MDKNENQIREVLKKITRNHHPDKWEKNYRFYPGEIDSLDMVTFALHVEETFDIKISDDMLSDMYSIENVVRGVKDLINESKNISS